MTEYYGCKEIKEGIFERKTKEVKILLRINNNQIFLSGEGDCRHHLLEDSAILIKKVLGGHEQL